MEYRRGVGSAKGNRFWHFHWNCELYPNTAYVLTTERPSDDELCAKCQAHSDSGLKA